MGVRGITCLLLGIGFAASAEPFPIETQDFRLWDSRGQSHILSYYSDKSAILFLSYPQDCESEKDIFHWYSALESKLIAKHIQAFWINGQSIQDRARVNKEVAGDFLAPVLMDASQVTSRRLGFKNVGDFVMVDTKTWQKIQSGGWQDGSLEKLLEVPREKSAEPKPKCAFRLRDRSQVTWNKGLAKKVMNDCIYCHLNYTSADLFSSDQDLFSWASMSLLSIRLGKMPLNGFDFEESLCGNFFSHGRLDPKDISEIENWLDAGAPRKESKTDYLAQMVAEEKLRMKKEAEALGEPAVVWTTPAEKMPLQGADYYRFYQIAGPLPEDLAIGAMVITKGAVTPHHLDLHALPIPWKEFERTLPEHNDLAESIAVEPYAKLVSLPIHLTKFTRSHVFFPKGSYVVAVVHYHPNGKLSDVAPTTIRGYAATDEKPERLLNGFTLRKGDLEIAPQERNHHVILKKQFDRDIEIESIAVHTHSRGKSIEISSIAPNGQSTLLCRANEFNLDFISSLPHPAFISKGSTLKAEFIYDNSSQNPVNTDFAKPIKIGPYLTDEMGNIRFIYHDARP